MKGYELFIREASQTKWNEDQLRKKAQTGVSEYRVYPDSIQIADHAVFFLARDGLEKALVICRGGEASKSFQGTESQIAETSVKVCPLNHQYACALRAAFPFTAPKSRAGHKVSMGLGDRLGLASPGHIRAIKGREVFPILAQQSMRELSLTNRTYADVIDSATWAVFQEGYQLGFGADGDHLKTPAEVSGALNAGVTMITLDCSMQIRNDIGAMSGSEIQSLFDALPAAQAYMHAYAGQTFALDGLNISYTAEDLRQIALVYSEAIDFTVQIYQQFIQSSPRALDFEISIDETLSETSPQAHFFVASELQKRGVVFSSLAPRFCGEFQKGIDYRGDFARFTQEFPAHAAVALHFGYQLSIHSGSDKFTVFPTIGQDTHRHFHLKTAGTNWLEALRVIAQTAPALFRRIAAFALEHLPQAKAYYHITENTANIPALDTLRDEDLPQLLEQDDARQVLHVTYGLVLCAAAPDGTSLFKEALYKVLRENEEAYYDAVCRHIGRHLDGLGM